MKAWKVGLYPIMAGLGIRASYVAAREGSPHLLWIAPFAVWFVFDWFMVLRRVWRSYRAP